MKYADKKLGRYHKGVVPLSLQKAPRKSNKAGDVVFMQAKFQGVCVACGDVIEVGQHMRWNTKVKKGKHAGCK